MLALKVALTLVLYVGIVAVILVGVFAAICTMLYWTGWAIVNTSRWIAGRR